MRVITTCISKETLLAHQLNHYAERLSSARSVKERSFLRQQLHFLKKGAAKEKSFFFKPINKSKMRRQITQDDLNNFPFLKDKGYATGQELDFNEEGFPVFPEADAAVTQSGSENDNAESLTDGRPEGDSQTNGDSEEKSEEKTDETENTENTEETTESEKLTDGEGEE